MRKIRFRDEHGSALVMVLFMALLLTILGTAVVAAAIGGAQRTQTRENDVQSLHLAEKALDEGASYIFSELDSKNIEPEKLDGVIRNYMSELEEKIKAGQLTLGSELGANGVDKVFAKITEIKYNKSSTSATEYPITLKSEAVVNGVKRKLSREIVIDTFPDFLRYALGSEGDLILNGSPDMKGNIYAGQNLQLSNTAHYTHGNAYDAPTLFPVLLPAGAEGQGEGEAHIQSLKKVGCFDQGIGQSPFQAGGCEMPLGSAFDPAKNLRIKPLSKFVSINVEESFNDKAREALDPNSLQPSAKDSGQALVQWYDDQYKSDNNGHSSAPFLQLEMPEEPAYPPIPGEGASEEEITKYNADIEEYSVKLAVYTEELNKLVTQLADLNQSAIFRGDLSVDGSILQSLKINKSQGSGKTNWLIVTGNLNIDARSAGDIGVAGNILVTGNIAINGNVHFDSTVFTLGKTEIVDASIQGLNGKELVLIGKGPIEIYRVDAFKNTERPTVLSAFFYTDDKAELYGVGSAFHLKGGFFAKGDLTINAMRGSATGPSGSSDPLVFEQQVGEQQAARFSVEYNGDVFKHQYIGLPRVSKISVRIGSLKLES
ncbi:hypothetical protein P4H66_16585 [Paenibacillus dokdonensis]|uniref:Type 4 fimbrial biogenesis protein PilX N-terminal domain-containing protein n=1 Tax=Paenibacillus dokdonensis TaxID=2567944 RepID=A0ABU6GNZ7_9BACL|nr:hypothetical protein [Paenibacillus dokdonensis]MEC0241440.1 hypothetical protein [Paenibacillus dokdonensis]